MVGGGGRRKGFGLKGLGGGINGGGGGYLERGEKGGRKGKKGGGGGGKNPWKTIKQKITFLHQRKILTIKISTTIGLQGVEGTRTLLLLLLFLCVFPK